MPLQDRLLLLPRIESCGSSPGSWAIRVLSHWLAPSSDFRMMSACPACWAISAIKCSSTRRADQRLSGSTRAPGQWVGGIEIGQAAVA